MNRLFLSQKILLAYFYKDKLHSNKFNYSLSIYKYFCQMASAGILRHKSLKELRRFPEKSSVYFCIRLIPAETLAKNAK